MAVSAELLLALFGRSVDDDEAFLGACLLAEFMTRIRLFLTALPKAPKTPGRPRGRVR